jgi:hypothetical protein
MSAGRDPKLGRASGGAIFAMLANMFFRFTVLSTVGKKEQNGFDDRR